MLLVDKGCGHLKNIIGVIVDTDDTHLDSVQWDTEREVFHE